MSDIAIKIDGLTYFYPADEGTAPVDVLRGLTLELESGSFTAVLGHNGSGKSTLARHLNALLLPKGGSVYVFGMDTRMEELVLEIRRRVGMVFQNPDNQIVSNVVEEDVAFAPENLGVPSPEIRERVDEALKMVGMYEFRNHAPHLLSGGQRQRIAIAGVLAMRPKCVVFDEPTAMLDPRGREEVMGIIYKLRREYGSTVILITHHMEEAARADRVIVMDSGLVAMDGSPREVFSNVEELSALGLDVPEETRLLYELRREGLNVPLCALDARECAGALAKYFKKTGDIPSGSRTERNADGK